MFQSSEPYFNLEVNGSYLTAMILLITTNVVALLGELSEIFRKKFSIEFTGFSRVVAFFTATPLLVVTMIFTENTEGKELIWLIWLKISLSISVFQVVNIFYLVV